MKISNGKNKEIKLPITADRLFAVTKIKGDVMSRALLFFVFFSTYLLAYSVNQYVYQFRHLTHHQKEVLKQVWYKAKPYDLSYTMSAIAFKESSLGVVLFNRKDGEIGSYGVFHNLVGSVYDRYVSFKPKSKNKELSIKLGLAKRLIDDFDFSFSQSLAELEFWKNMAKTKGYWNFWKYMIVCYNGGTNGIKNKKSLNYYKEVVKIIKALKITKKELKLN